MHRFIYPVILPADPSLPLEAATKQYVDAHAGSGGGGSLPLRTTTTFTTGLLVFNANETGLVTLDRGYRLLKISTDRAARVRLYTTTTKRNADISRPIGTAIGQGADHGLMLEFITASGFLSADLSPTVDGFDSDTDGIIPWSITNLSTGTSSVSVTFTWISTEGT